MPWENVQDGHEHGKPQLLGVEHGPSVASPLAGSDVVCVGQDDKGPRCLSPCQNQPLRLGMDNAVVASYR